MDMIAFLRKRSQFFWVIMGIILIVVVGIVDYLSGYEIAFSLFYLIPVSLVAWFTQRWLGIAASIFSAMAWLVADILSGHSYSYSGIYYWNSAIRLGIFVIVALLLSELKKALEHERDLARADSLTGAVNGRSFSELVQMEVARSQRYEHAFTVAYIDLDNFKAVNDQFGHSVGDKVLTTVVKCAKERLRKVDVVARLGGDEFAFLLPETGPEAAQVVISQVQKNLLSEMRKNNWPVTFSIGVLTCIKAPSTTDELIRLADELMYSVKNNGKDAICYSIYPN
jgi:diguanylate cyclase (GGDEF)-like protein